MAARSALITRRGIREKYSVGASVVTGWVGHPDFPAAQQADPAAPGLRRGTEQYPAAAVDRWVRKHENTVWLATHHGDDAARKAALKRLPAGGPDDLLDLDDFGTILGNFNRGKPIARGTMQSYRSRGQIPAADRWAGDGKTPEVYEDMWRRETVNDHVVDQRGMGARGVPKPKKDQEALQDEQN